MELLFASGGQKGGRCQARKVYYREYEEYLDSLRYQASMFESSYKVGQPKVRGFAVNS